jgi:hypothetical protein
MSCPSERGAAGARDVGLLAGVFQLSVEAAA